jgi:hypothetical protein
MASSKIGPLVFKAYPQLSELIHYAVEIYMLIFVAYFTGAIVVGGIQHYKRKDLWDTRAFPVLYILHSALILPFILPVLPFLALGWLRKRFFGKSSSPQN